MTRNGVLSESSRIRMPARFQLAGGGGKGGSKRIRWRCGKVKWVCLEKHAARTWTRAKKNNKDSLKLPSGNLAAGVNDA